VLAQSFINLPRRFEFDVTARYISSVPYFAVPSYFTADVRLGRRFGERFEISVVGRNLLQPSHAEYGGDPGGLVRIKRSAYVKVTWTR
jgi:iron complex outermembrane receptor protein